MKLEKIQDIDFMAFVELLFRAKRTPYIKGPPGSGKSAMAEALARRLNDLYKDDGGYGYFEIDCAKANIADWQGFLMPKDEVVITHDGQSVTVMAGKYTMPYWAYCKFSGRSILTFKRGCIAFEEWAQCDTEVKRASSSMLHGRRLGLWHFPDFDCMLLGNRDVDRAGTTKEYDHIINRLTIVEMQPTLTNFLVVANELGMTAITQAFAHRNTERVFNAGIPKEQGPYLTQRSLHALDDIVKSALAIGMDLNDPILLTAAVGTVGMEDATRYMAFVKARHKIPPISQVVNDPHGCPIPDEGDLVAFLVYDMANKVDRTTMPAMWAYLTRLPSSWHATFFDAATRRDKTLVATKEYTSYAKDNLGMMSASIMANRRQ